MSVNASPDVPSSSPTPDTTLLIVSLLIRESRYSVAETLRNFIKILTGRKFRFNERRPFLWPILLHLTGIRSLDKITCRPPSCEGPGSQIFSTINAINFARCAGLTYVHTPFAEIQHADRPMRDWAAAWEALFNLGACELRCETSKRKVLNHSHHATSLALCLGWDHRHNEIQRSFQAMIPDLRRKYYLNKSPRQNQKLTVAVHVRRGWDVGSLSASYRLKRAESILRTITRAKNILDSRGTQHLINVYSEGDRADFEELCFAEIPISKYRVGRQAHGRTDDLSAFSLSNGESVLDIDALQAMQDMIEADVLIIAASSFSYCAAIISDGIIISGPTGDRPWIDTWLTLNDNGTFDAAAFELRLSQLTQRNPAKK